MIAALITALCLLAAGATVWIRGWLARRDATRDAGEKVETARAKEAADVARADATLDAERKRGAVDAANDPRFGP